MCKVETVSDGNCLNLFCNVECTPHESCAWFAQCCLLLWLRAADYTLILKEYSLDTGVMMWLYSASEIITGICVRYNNSSLPNVAYMFQWIWSASVQIMAFYHEVFIHENTENIVCQIAARGTWVKQLQVMNITGAKQYTTKRAVYSMRCTVRARRSFMVDISQRICFIKEMIVG